MAAASWVRMVFFVDRLWGRDTIQGNYGQLVVAMAKMYKEEPARAAVGGVDNSGL